LWNAPGDASGSNPNPEGVRRFSLRSPQENANEPAGRACSIFLAEDNPADSGLVRKALEEHGFAGELSVADDGEKAIRFIRSLDRTPFADCPDLVIIDLSLPRKSGREVLETMRRSERCRHVPVVILSSSDAQRDRADAALLGASRYIRKPSRLEDFLRLGAVFKEIIGSV
jgi:chemotaxis family two-component system response regulator Rcp1